MKRIFVTFVVMLLAAGAWAQVQEVEKVEIKVPNKRYINLAYATQSMKFDATSDVPAHALKSDLGAALEFGTTYFLNGRKPVLGMIRFGIDWSYADLQYATFKLGVDENGKKMKGHFANIGMQLGLSVTVTPIKNLHAKAYAHYAPSFAGFFLSDFSDIKGGYAGYITGGVQVSYKAITLGVEMRSASAKLAAVNTDVDFDYDSEDIGGMIGDAVDQFMGPKVKTKLPSTRLILGFRF